MSYNKKITTAGLLLLAFILGLNLSGCSSDNNVDPLAPPAKMTDSIVVKDVGYNKYIGGNKIAKGIASYYVLLSNTTCQITDEAKNPMPTEDGDMLILDLYAPDDTLASSPVLPTGDYYMGFAKDAYTLNIDQSAIVRHTGSENKYIALNDGEIHVTKDDAGNYTIDCALVQANGKSLVYTFKGKLKFDDITYSQNSISTLTDDVMNTPFTTCKGTYNGDAYQTGTGNYVLQLYTDGFATGDSQTGISLMINLFSQLADDSTKAGLKEGTYTVVPIEQETGQEYTIRPGRILYNKYSFGTLVYRVDDEGTEEAGYITGGTLKVENTGDGVKLTYDFLTDNRKKVTGSYTGPVSFEQQSADKQKAGLFEGPFFLKK